LSQDTGRTPTNAFTVLTVVNLVISFFGALILWLQFTPKRSISQFDLFGVKVLGWFEPIENVVEYEFSRPLLSLPLPIIAIILYAIAYLTSFDPLAPRRPMTRLFILHFSLAMVAAALVGSGLALEPGIVTWIILSAILVGYPLAALGVERGAGNALSSLSHYFFKKDRYHAANSVLAISMRLNPGDRGQQRELGISRFDMGDVVGTIDVLGPLATSDCQDEEVLRILEECYRTERQWAQAQEVNHRQLELKPDSEDLRIRGARILEEMGRRDEAIEILREGLPSDRPEYLEQLLVLNMRKKDLKAALETVRSMEKSNAHLDSREEQAYRAILEIDPKRREALEGLGDLLVRQHRVEQGYDLLEQVVRLDPSRHDLRGRLVHYYQTKDLLKMAEPHLAALIDAGRDSVDIALLYGNVLIQREEYDHALMHFQRAVENYPEDYRFAYFLAQIYFKNQAFEDARRWCREAEKRAKQPKDHTRLKTLRKRIDQALASRELQVLEERSHREPHNVDLRMQLIETLCEHDLVGKAITESDSFLSLHGETRGRVILLLERCAEQEEQNFRLLDFLADLKIEEKQWDGAYRLAKQMAEKSMNPDEVMAEHCRRILKENPDHVLSLESLATIYLQHENWEKVLEAEERLLQLGAGNDRQHQDALVQACMALGRPEKALDVARNLVAENPHDLTVRLKLVKLFAAGGDYGKAFEHLNVAQSMDYYNAEVVELMTTLREKRKRRDLQRLLEVIDKEPDNMQAQMQAGDLYSEMNNTKRSIACYQRVIHDPEMKNRAGVKLARAMIQLRMFDLAEETLDEVELRSDNADEEQMLKKLCYEVAEAFQQENMQERAAKFFKKIFRVDAAFEDVVDRIETLSEQ